MYSMCIPMTACTTTQPQTSSDTVARAVTHATGIGSMRGFISTIHLRTPCPIPVPAALPASVQEHQHNTRELDSPVACAHRWEDNTQPNAWLPVPPAPPGGAVYGSGAGH